MYSPQDELEVDDENNRTIFFEGDRRETLRRRTKHTTSDILTFPHTFLKEDRWLFSPPPVLTVATTKLDNFKTEFSCTPMTQRYGTNHQFLGKKQPTLLSFTFRGTPTKEKD